MPARPPLCPAFSASQALTLWTIPEDGYSPLQPHEAAVFADFSWRGALSPATSALSDMMNSNAPSLISQQLENLSLQYAKLAHLPSPKAKSGLGLVNFDFASSLSLSSVFEEHWRSRKLEAASGHQVEQEALASNSKKDAEDDMEGDDLPLQTVWGRLAELKGKEGYGDKGFNAKERKPATRSGTAATSLERAVVCTGEIVKVPHPVVGRLRSKSSIFRTPSKEAMYVDGDEDGDRAVCGPHSG